MIQVVTLVILVVANVVSGQSGQCYPNPNQSYACVTRTQFLECSRTTAYGQLQTHGELHDCSILNGAGTNAVCYGGATNHSDMCGRPPPPCLVGGDFAIPGRCRNFYTCVNTGLRFQQYINECELGYEFSPRMQRCALTALAGCSVGIPSFLSNNLSTTSGTGTTTTLNAEQTIVCPIGERRVPDPTNCAKFYVCNANGKAATLTKCPFNLLFNTTNKLCGIPNSVDCGTRPKVE